MACAIAVSSAASAFNVGMWRPSRVRWFKRARRGKAERAGADACLGQRRHLLAIMLRRPLAIGAALAHDIDAQRRVWHLRGDVDIVVPCLECIEVVRKAVPVPRQAFGQHDLGDVLDAFHQLHQHVALLCMARCEADAAIAEQHGGDTVPRGGRQRGTPGHLRVVMRVHVDEAGHDQLALGIDLLGALGQRRADGRNAPIGDGDVGLERIAARTVHDGAVADDQGWGLRHGRLLPAWRGSRVDALRGERQARWPPHTNKLPLPLREGVGGRGLGPHEPLPPTPSLKGRGSLFV